MNPYKYLKISGIVCLICGIIITIIVYLDGHGLLRNKILGPLNIINGCLFILISSNYKQKNL